VLTTFDLLRTHPPAGAIDIISDRAAMGALHAMRAEARVKHLSAEMVRLSKDDKEIDADEAGNQLRRIARSLFESVKLWDGNPFISQASTFLQLELQEAVAVSLLGRHIKANGEAVAAQIKNVASQMLASGMDPEYIDVSGNPLAAAAKGFALDVYHIPQDFVTIMQFALAKMIFDAKQEGEPGSEKR
jgi:hypothetical protein